MNFDFAETDWMYVDMFYRTGTIPPWETCVVRGAKPVDPLPLPPLAPRLVEVRYAF